MYNSKTPIYLKQSLVQDKDTDHPTQTCLLHIITYPTLTNLVINLIIFTKSVCLHLKKTIWILKISVRLSILGFVLELESINQSQAAIRSYT